MERVEHPAYKQNEGCISFRIPSSVLLFGEYNITQSGGMGVATTGQESAWTHIFLEKNPQLEIVEAESSYKTLYISYTCPVKKDAKLEIIDRNAFETIQNRNVQDAEPFKVYLRCMCKPSALNDSQIHRMWKSCLTSCCKTFRKQKLQERKRGRLMATCIIDTEELHGSEPRQLETKKTLLKKGLSSSACSCIAMCASIWILAGQDPLQDPKVFSATAIRAHMCFQDVGSGYDILTSYLGKTLVILQRGSARTLPAVSCEHTPASSPSEEQALQKLAREFDWQIENNGLLSWIVLPEYFVLQSLWNFEVVQSRYALQRFQVLVKNSDELVQHLLHTSNKHIIELIHQLETSNPSLPEKKAKITQLVDSLKRIGQLIGECIDIPAVIPEESEKEMMQDNGNSDAQELYICKPLGAGRESVGVLRIGIT